MLFQVVGMYENSACVATFMIRVAIATLSAIVDQVRVDEWPHSGWHTVGEL